MHKVTIIPRGRALGVTMQLPVEDRYSYDRDYLLNNIAVLFGGRIAEELFMNQMTTGASNDFKRATEMARRMVTEWGMTDALGPMVYGENEGEVFLGRQVTTHQNMSEETMKAVDKEVRTIIDSSTPWRAACSSENRDKVEVMAKALLEWETIDANQIEDIMNGRPAAASEARGAEARALLGRQRQPRPGACPVAGGRKLSAEPMKRDEGWRRATPFSFDTPGRPLVMGVVNVTDDSFSDGGRFRDPSRAIEQGFRLREEGADLVDVGGESTRPGAAPVPADEELRRVLPVIEALARAGVAVSVDTMKPEVMRAAIAAGCAVVNDVNAFLATGAVEAVAQADVGLVVMHMQGTPRTMQQAPRIR